MVPLFPRSWADPQLLLPPLKYVKLRLRWAASGGGAEKMKGPELPCGDRARGSFPGPEKDEC